MTEPIVRLIEESCNTKLSPVRLVPYTTPEGKSWPRREPSGPRVASTFLPIEQTCPDVCPFKAPQKSAKSKEGTRPCYAAAGFTRHLVRRLEDAAKGLAPGDIGRLEAEAMDMAFGGGPIPQDGARGGRDLRQHVSGDMMGPGVVYIAEAAERWEQRGGGQVWTYTHWWRDMHRSFWGPISVLASVERPEQIRQARRMGYAAAIVMDMFPASANGKIFSLPGGHRVLPCPNETRGMTCVECRACLRSGDLLRTGLTIGFQSHGTMASTARKRLPVLGRPQQELAF